VSVLTTTCPWQADPLNAIFIRLTGLLLGARADTSTLYTNTLSQTVYWTVTTGRLCAAPLFTAHRSRTFSVLNTARDAALSLAKTTTQAACIAQTGVRLSTETFHLITAEFSLTGELWAGSLTMFLDTNSTGVAVFSAATDLRLLTTARFTMLRSAALGIFHTRILTATRFTEAIKETTPIIQTGIQLLTALLFTAQASRTAHPLARICAALTLATSITQTV